MPCFDEKVTAGLAGAATTAVTIGVSASTATGPAFFAAAAGWLVACAGFANTLFKLILCLEANGQPEIAALIRSKADAIMREIDDFKAWARSLGASL